MSCLKKYCGLNKNEKNLNTDDTNKQVYANDKIKIIVYKNYLNAVKITSSILSNSFFFFSIFLNWSLDIVVSSATDVYWRFQKDAAVSGFPFRIQRLILQ